MINLETAKTQHSMKNYHSSSGLDAETGALRFSTANRIRLWVNDFRRTTHADAIMMEIDSSESTSP